MSEPAANVPIHASTSKDQHKRRILIFCAVSLINIGLLALLWTQLLTPATGSQSNPLIGHTAPAFSLVMVGSTDQQSMLKLADFKGKAIVLNFWASWCGPCKEEAPLLEQSWQQMQKRNIVFLGVDFQESSSSVLNFVQAYHITYPVVLDTHGAVANQYGVTSLPVTVFINRQGVIVSKETQELTTSILTNNLHLIL